METEMELYKILVYPEPNRDDVLQHIEMIAETQDSVSKELLALAYAVLGKVSLARDVLMSIDENHENRFVLEAKLVLEIRQRNRANATILAHRILDKYPDAAFARYFLAFNAVMQRKMQEASDHYQTFLQYYPRHNNAILLLSETLAYLGKYQDAIRYVKQSKPSLKRQLYLLLVPSVLPIYRLMILFAGFLAAVMGLPIVFLGVVLVLLFIGIVISLIKNDGTLLPARLLYLGVMITISWLFGHWVWFLLTGG